MAVSCVTAVSRKVFHQYVKQSLIRTSCCRRFCQETSQGTDRPAHDNDSHEDGEETEFQTKQRVLQSSLPFVKQHGWTKHALAAGAEVEGLPGIAHGLFPRGGVELIYYFYKDCNSRLATQLAEEVKKEQEEGAEEGVSRISPFIASAVERRLRMIIPYIDKWPQAMGILALPQNTPESLGNLLDLTDEIWHHAGDTSKDFNWYTKRVSLGALYKSTEVFMVQDKSEDFEETWAFLDNRMEDLGNLGKFARNAQQTGSIMSEAALGLCIMGRNILGMNAKAK